MSPVALRIRLSALLLAPAVLQAQAPAAREAPPASRQALVARIDSLAADHLAHGPASSVAIAVVHGRDTLVMRGYGLADREAKRAAGPETVYEIGSITKQFTAAGILRLVEQGQVGLDDDLSKYVPTFPLQGRRVTIRQLLNHTSGIRSYTGKPEWRATWKEALTPDSIVGFVARDTFDFAPGTAWRYNNTGYVLLGMVIEKASGQPYATFLEEQFFRPLGLRQTRYCPERPSRAGDTTFAVGYSVRGAGGEMAPAEHLSMTHPFSAGALCSSVRDYLTWQRALHGGRVLSAESYRLMTTPDTLPDGKQHRYGFGLMTDTLGPHRVIEHGGGIPGYVTAQLYVPAESLSVIAFTNTDATGADPLAENIARAVLGLPLVERPKTPPVAPLAAEVRAKLPGVYDLKRPDGGTLTLHVRLEGETLVAQAPGQPAMPLLHLGDQVFGIAVDPTLRLTFLGENGQITRIRLQQRGVTLEGTRRE